MNLSKLSHEKQVAAILTASPAAIRSAIGKITRAARKTVTRAGGRPPVIRECPRCHIQLPTAAMRRHKCSTDPA